MATAEGVYPKIGNDPIYASEINGYGQNIFVLNSGTDLNFVGSLYNLGSIYFVTSGAFTINGSVLNRTSYMKFTGSAKAELVAHSAPSESTTATLIQYLIASGTTPTLLDSFTIANATVTGGDKTAGSVLVHSSDIYDIPEIYKTDGMNIIVALSGTFIMDGASAGSAIGSYINSIYRIECFR